MGSIVVFGLCVFQRDHIGGEDLDGAVVQAGLTFRHFSDRKGAIRKNHAKVGRNKSSLSGYCLLIRRKWEYRQGIDEYFY